MRWKWFLGICAFLIIVLLVAVYVYLNTFDYNKLKPRIARMVKDATGRELNLAGEVDLAIGFSPALVVTDVAFANAPWGSQPQMIKIETLQARVRLLSLLHREVEVQNIGLTGVDILLETDSNGKGNWEFIAEDRKGNSTEGFTFVNIDIDAVQIKNLRFAYRQGKTAPTTQYTLASLDVARSDSENELTLNLKADYNNQPIALSGKIGRIHSLFTHQRFPLNLSGTLSNATVKIDGAIDDFLNLQGIDLKVNASCQDLSAIGPIIGQALPKTDQFALKGRLTGSAKALSLKEAQGSASRDSLRFTVNGTVKDFFTLAGMDLQSRLSGTDLTEFGVVIGEKLPATDQFEIQGRLTGSTDVLALQAAQGNAGRGSMRLNITGTVKDLLTLDGMDLQSRLNGRELAEIGPVIGSKLPELGPFEVNAKVSGSSKAISFNAISAMVEKSDFKGLAKLEFLKRPKISASLESSVIDFTTLMKSLENGKQKPVDKENQKPRLFSDAPLPLDLLKKLDADIVLKARNIRVKEARLDFGRLALKLKDHDFSVDKLEATYKETKISGNLQITADTPPQVATHFLVQDFNLGDFLKETGKSDQVRATIDIAAHGKSSGDSVHSLMMNLDGAIGIVMGEGYLTKYLDMLSSGLTHKVFQIWKPHKAVDQIECAVVQFDFNDGVAASRAFVFDTRAGVLTGEGDINLGTEKINFLLVPKPASPEFSFLTNLRVSGTVMEPHVGIDKASALTRGARALSALLVGPIGLLAPFVHLGAHKAHPCKVQSIGQLGLKTPAQDEQQDSYLQKDNHAIIETQTPWR
ncbi:MAG: AsmA family protein [Desulfobacterales bacterium]|jgi:uncharacterized protein involved in outer membrane biogenesis